VGKEGTAQAKNGIVIRPCNNAFKKEDEEYISKSER
jgi:hypothetical protein